jgi:hypothetical protein
LIGFLAQAERLFVGFEAGLAQERVGVAPGGLTGGVLLRAVGAAVGQLAPAEQGVANANAAQEHEGTAEQRMNLREHQSRFADAHSIQRDGVARQFSLTSCGSAGSSATTWQSKATPHLIPLTRSNNRS